MRVDDWLLDSHNAPGFLRWESKSHLETKAGQIHHTEHLHFRIPRRYALVNVHEKVVDSLKRSGIKDGFCFVSAMHITAGVYVNDAENGLLKDIAKWIRIWRRLEKTITIIKQAKTMGTRTSSPI